MTSSPEHQGLEPVWPKGKYIPVQAKLWIGLAVATVWVSASLYLARPWAADLAQLWGPVGAWIIVSGIALIPGFLNAFIITELLLDRRPGFELPAELPGLSVLIAAYNEEGPIAETLDSMLDQDYRGPLQLIVVDDGSTDRTAEIVEEYATREDFQNGRLRLEVIRRQPNAGKSDALNAGLEQCEHELIATVDADSYLCGNAFNNIVTNHVQSPPGTASTAGCVLVGNSRVSLITRLQEWDYFLGISVVKRVQSLLQGTLVAQGAFSVYDRDVVRELGGWPTTVGEDIVLTWGMMKAGYRVGYAENALVFTHVPESYDGFYRQRRRWARGLIEAFLHHPGVLLRPRLNAPFVWANFFFPLLDFCYLFIFVPGVVAAVVFQHYAVVGLSTLFVLPLALMMYIIMYRKQLAVFGDQGLGVRRNYLGALVFVLGYQVFLSPASVLGYCSELLRLRKVW